MLTKNTFCPAVLTIGLIASFAHAAVVTDPGLVTGSGAIDPSGSREVDTLATNSMPKATLTALDGFGAVQIWSGVDSGSAGENILSFTDSSLPDVRLSFSGSRNGQAGGQITNSSYVTSGESGLRFYGSSATATVVLTIDFGSWDGSNFDGSVNAVRAVGFTHSPFYDGITLVAEYFNAVGNSLVTQVYNNNTGSSKTVYYGYDAGPNGNISYVVLTRTATANGSTAASIDDLGFAIVIPEPATLALLAAGGMLMLTRRRKA